MMTIEDAAPYVTLIQCIHRMHWSIYGAKTSAFIACTGPFMGPKPVLRDALIDLRSVLTWLWDHQTVPTPTLDALRDFP